MSAAAVDDKWNFNEHGGITCQTASDSKALKRIINSFHTEQAGYIVNWKYTYVFMNELTLIQYLIKYAQAVPILY